MLNYMPETSFYRQISSILADTLIERYVIDSLSANCLLPNNVDTVSVRVHSPPNIRTIKSDLEITALLGEHLGPEYLELLTVYGRRFTLRATFPITSCVSVCRWSVVGPTARRAEGRRTEDKTSIPIIRRRRE